MDFMQCIIALTGLTGHFFVARKNLLGYWFWIIGNIATVMISMEKQLYVLAGLFVTYTVIALLAIRKWKKDESERRLSDQLGQPCRCISR